MPAETLVPREIRTQRLLLRPWAPGDAARMKAAIDDNLDHLRPWMPWAVNEPSPLDAIEKRIEFFESKFAAGEDWTFAILSADASTVVGGTGLHRRTTPDALEIGYWIDKRFIGRGYATEAAAALTQIGLALPGISRIEIRCDPRNASSASIPRRLGYKHITTIPSEGLTPTGEPRDTMVWEKTRAETAGE